MSLLETIEKTMIKHNMINSGDAILVALSGGADSVCLLKVMCLLKDKYNLKIYAAHLNHMLRGKDADGDEFFAKQLCERWDVSFFSKKADVSLYAKENSLTSEEAGRVLRYEFFNEIIKEQNISKIATAHNLNDDVETVLMRFIRGTGIAGLCGIPYVNNNIIRPLLDVSRKEIEEFLSCESICFVTDKTNFQPVYFRNKVRLDMIPQIEEYNPNFKKTLSQNITGYKEASDYIECIVSQKAAELICHEKSYSYIAADDLKKEHNFIKKSIIRLLLEKMTKSKQITYRAVNDICDLADKKSGVVEFSKDLSVHMLYGKLFFVKKRKIRPYSCRAENLNEVIIEETGQRISFAIANKKERKKDCIYLDYDKIKSKDLVIRNRRAGDVFCPSGMKGKKKLKDFFIDLKLANFLRDEIPLVVIEDEIACVGTLRESEKYKVESDTKSILKIEIFYGG